MLFTDTDKLKIEFKHVITGFDPELENEFYDDFFKNSLLYIRLMLILACFLYAIFGILDLWAFPLTKDTIWIIRYVFICPIILLYFTITFTPIFKKIMFGALFLFGFIVGAGLLIFMAIAKDTEPGYHLYYAALILVMMGNYTLFRLRFMYAVISSWIIIFAYEFVAIYFHDMLAHVDKLTIFINNNFYLISVNVIGILACFLIEYYVRNDFLLRKKIWIEEEKEKMKTEQELAKTRQELSLTQSTLQSMELETDAGLRNISHSIKNKHAVQKGMSKILSRIMLLLKDAVQQLEEKIPEAFNKSINHILDYFENTTLSKLQKDNGDLSITEYKRFFNELKRTISRSFEKKNLDKIKNFISKKIENYSQEAITSLDGLYINMNSIIDYIYAIISYQRGKEIDIKSHVNSTLKRVYYNILDTYEKELETYHIKFDYENKTDEVVVLQIYDFILEEDIIRNLFLNSFRALLESDPENTRKDKRIWIEAYSEKDTTGKDFFIIHFKDNGPGVPVDKKQMIFEGYSSKAESRKLFRNRNIIEHGVGCSTVKKRIEEMGGTIIEQGVPGEGADFKIKINKQFKKHFKNKPEVLSSIYKQIIGSEMQLKDKRALVIDDTQAIREELGLILKGAGLDVIMAANLNEARDKIYNKYDKPDIIILDLDLGINTGEELLLELMGKKEGEIPVVVVSGSDRAYYEDKLKSLKAVEVFQKPVNEQELVKSVRQILSENN
ncbi:MAG: response regulator [Spirochaetia bacterium]